jgi:membrane-associated protease RseP (regulator of RpoE activity)
MSQQYYLPIADADYERPTVIHRLPQPVRHRPAGRLWLHLLLLALTSLTTTGIGTLLFYQSDLASAAGSGLFFSFTLISILGAHEMGHYIACRYHGVSATLPYFIPAPIGIGTFGAFIRIKSAIPGREALFDIGIAGPLAGFVFALPAAFVAHYFAGAAPPMEAGGDYLIFHSPPLFRLFELAFALPPEIELNPIWLAAWVGLLMTALNLLPIGQLDGGHVTYAVFGERAHRLLARIIYLLVVALALYSLLPGRWKGWIIYALLLTLMMRVGHPQLSDDAGRLGMGRRLVAALGLIVFLLCFTPFPITY